MDKGLIKKKVLAWVDPKTKAIYGDTDRAYESIARKLNEQMHPAN